MNIIHKILTQDDINSITKDSPIPLLNALYQCENIIEVVQSNNHIFNDNETKKFFTYTSSLYLSFLSTQSSLNNTYIQARKDLYHSISQIKQEIAEQELQELKKQQEILEKSLQGLDSKQKEIKVKALQKQQEKEFRNKQIQEQQQVTFKDTSNLILESQDKSITIIFLDKLNSKSLDKNISMSNLIHLHNNKIDIFTKDKITIHQGRMFYRCNI